MQGALAIMPASDLVNLSGLLDNAKCFALVRQLRWPEGVRCPGCGRDTVIRDGCDDTQPHRHGAGRAPSAAAGVGAVPLSYGPEPLQPTDRFGAGPEPVRRAGHDTRASA